MAQHGDQDDSPVPRRLRADRSASPTPTRRPRSSTPSTSSTSTTAASTSTRASPIAPGYRTINDASRPARSTSSRAEVQRQFSKLTWKDLVEGGYVIAGCPGHRARAHGGHDHVAAPRPRLLPDAHRQPARLEDALLDAAVRREGDAAACGTCGPSTRTTTAGGSIRSRTRARRRRDVRRRASPRGASRNDRRDVPPLERTTVTTRRGITCEVLVGAPASGRPRARSCASTAPAACSATSRCSRALAESLRGVRADLAGLRRAGRRGDARGHARLHPARLGHRRRARPRPAAPRRSLDGRDDRGRDGGRRADALRQARADRAARPVARRAPDHRHLLAASRSSSRRCCSTMQPRAPRSWPAALDFNDTEAIKTFFIANDRRLGTAGKMLFPIPDRKVAKRLYRITNPTLLVWGDDDRYVPQPYAEAWRAAIDGAELEIIPEAGHMVPYEQPGDVAGVIAILRGVTRETAELPVVISGGGLVGLSTAMFLAQHGVPSLVVERLRGRLAAAPGGALPPPDDRAVPCRGHRRRGEGAIREGVPPRGRDHQHGHPRGAEARRHHPRAQRRSRRHAEPVPAPVHQPARNRADPAQPREGRRRRSRRGQRGRRLRPGRGRRHRVGRRRGWWCDSGDPHAVPGRGRRRAQPSARVARHRVRGSRRVLEQHDDLLHGRSRAAAARQAAQRHLHQQRDDGRVLPCRQGLPARLPRCEHDR